MTKLVGLVGSLRKDSLNRKLLHAMATLVPEGVTLDEVEYGDVPLYNADLGEVEAVERIKRAIADADGVVIVTPEYNYGIPGPLKNVLDWASRPAYESVFSGKPVAVLGAAPGPIGTARAQGQLKQVLLGMVAHVFPHRELAIGSATTRLAGDGEFADESTRELLRDFTRSFVRFVGG